MRPALEAGIRSVRFLPGADLSNQGVTLLREESSELLRSIKWDIRLKPCKRAHKDPQLSFFTELTTAECRRNYNVLWSQLSE